MSEYLLFLKIRNKRTTEYGQNSSIKNSVMKILFFLFLCACCFSCTSNQKKDSEKNKQDKNHLLLGNHVITIMNKEFTHENPIDSISVEKILFLGYKIVNRVPSKNS